MDSTCLRRCRWVVATVALATSTVAITAQQPEPSITVTGCVNRAVNNGSLAGGPGVPPTTPNRAAILANSNEPTDVILLNGATPPPAREQAATAGGTRTLPVTYVLDGSLRDLEPHLGHQVEVTGSLQTVQEGAKDIKSTVRHLKVASIKTVATECPKSNTP